MPSGPCLGCGFELDGDGNMQVVGVTDNPWPYNAPGHTDPDAVYCDTASNRLWSQPWNLPWGIVAYNEGQGTGPYEATGAGNVVGVTPACSVNVTFKRDRRYLITGMTAVQSSVATIFDPGNPFAGALQGACIYNDTIAQIMVGASGVSAFAGYANTYSMSCSVVNATGADLVRTWSLRVVSRGLIQNRLYAYTKAYLMVQDVGPRL